MYFGDFTITKREILVSVAITLILIGLGFLISSGIENGINEENEKYYKALKIENDEDIFKYAIKTNVGYTLAQGKVQAIDGISIEDIDGKYFYIKKEKEKYTKHTREVEHTKTIGNETYTYYTTEEYWTWDYVGEEKWHIEKFKFLNKEFNYGIIKFDNLSYKETKQTDYYTRYNFYIIPIEFEGTLFTYINNNTINENTFYENNTIENIIKQKESEAEGFKILFWTVWIIFIGFVDFGYMYLDNNYLED